MVKGDKEKVSWIKKWKSEIAKHYKSIIFSVFLLVIAAVIDYNAGVYVTQNGSSVVSDFILSYIGPYNLSFLFVYGWLIIVGIFIVYPIIYKVSIFHKVLGQFSFLIILRSFFMTLTHLKTPLDAIGPSFPGSFNFLVFQNDLFFSGHTAVPFLAFLVYRGNPIRWFFLAASVVMAITVLLMHQHYSIDVFSAYFITYGSYKIAQFFSPFKK